MLWTTRVLPRASELREIVGDISEIETFAPGSGIRELASEGSMDATVGGSARELLVFRWLTTLSSWAEVHWYEASGIGRKEFKIKRFL